MRKVVCSLWAMGITVAAVAGMLTARTMADQPLPARMVRVERGSIRSVTALSGRLMYQEEHLTPSGAAGYVAEVYVKEGQRVAEGDALIRLDATAQERLAAACVAAGDSLVQGEYWLQRGDAARTLADTVVRAPVDGTVRQVLAGSHAAVVAGEPVVLLTSGRQEVRCMAVQADAVRIRPGMWAWISAGGEQLGVAWVTEVGPLTADAELGRLQSLITLSPEQAVALPMGAAVEADVCLQGREDVPVLPVEAITSRGTVWWVNEERCTEIPVEIIASDEMHAWVNLPEGMQVAVGEFEQGQRLAEVQP